MVSCEIWLLPFWSSSIIECYHFGIWLVAVMVVAVLVVAVLGVTVLFCYRCDCYSVVNIAWSKSLPNHHWSLGQAKTAVIWDLGVKETTRTVNITKMPKRDDSACGTSSPEKKKRQVRVWVDGWWVMNIVDWMLFLSYFDTIDRSQILAILPNIDVIWAWHRILIWQWPIKQKWWFTN